MPYAQSVNLVATVAGAAVAAVSFAATKTIIQRVAAANVTINYITEKGLTDDFLKYVKG